MANTVDPDATDLSQQVLGYHNSYVAFVQRIIRIKNNLASNDYSEVWQTVAVINELVTRQSNYTGISIEEERKILVPNFYETWLPANRADRNGVVNNAPNVRTAIVNARNRAPTTGSPNSFDLTYNATTFAYEYNTALASDVTALETEIDNILNNYVVGYPV